MRRIAGLLGVLLALALAAFAWPMASGAQEADGGGASALAVDRKAGLAAWKDVFAVFSHPRCANCHVADARPRWSGDHYGRTRVHGFNVQRGADGFGNPGLRCTTCHFEANAPARHGPPGAPHWQLAPARMVWFGKSSGTVCRQVKDPARNGDRRLDEIAIHVRDDPLVGWGWMPGPGREPAPGSAEETYRAIERWASAGAPCPEEGNP